MPIRTVSESPLQELASLHRVKTSYYDALGTFRTPNDECLVAVLKALGVEADSPSAVEASLALAREAECRPGIDPVIVRWGKDPVEFDLVLPASSEPDISFTLSLEDGTTWEVRPDSSCCSISDSQCSSWSDKIRTHFRIPADIPAGYHRMAVEGAGFREESLLIAAPERAFLRDGEKGWGLFAPVYSLRSRTDWGAGSLTEFESLTKWVAALGGRLVGTLPLFASFLDEPFSPSPYSPASRLFWNEFFADPTKYSHWDRCSPAQSLVQSESFQSRVDQARAEPLVDYRATARLKHEVLALLAEDAFRRKDLRPRLRDFARERPDVVQYARFRAMGEILRVPWPVWPESLRSGMLGAENDSTPEFRYHLFAQWMLQSQLAELLESARSRRVGLYLDLPLGVHPDGFDVWHYPSSFAEGVSGGAPPDGFFTEGQDWGFRPLNPEAERRNGYRYFRKVLSNLMGHSNVIRVDHALSLQRLFWIPVGMKATEGAYVYYPMEELFAVVVLESHRHQCVVVGEDLGTVSPELREQMEKRGICRMYVGQFEIDTDPLHPWNPVPQRVVASLNTHDTATAAGFWHGEDIDLRARLGLLEPEDLERESQERAKLRDLLLRYCGSGGSAADEQWLVLRRWLAHLAASPADYLLVNLEDLLQQRAPQNVPGTVSEYPNWRQKVWPLLELLKNDRRLIEVLHEIRTLRG